MNKFRIKLPLRLKRSLQEAKNCGCDCKVTNGLGCGM